MGGSYGGFMIVVVFVFEFEEFKVGINIFGVINWVRILNLILLWWESFKKVLYDEMGDFVIDGECYCVILLLFYVKNIIKLLMVI